MQAVRAASEAAAIDVGLMPSALGHTIAGVARRKETVQSIPAGRAKARRYADRDISPRFVDLDSWSTSDVIEAIYDGQLTACAAVRLP